MAFVIAHSDIEVLITTDLADEHTDFTTLLAKALPDLVRQDTRRPEPDRSPATEAELSTHPAVHMAQVVGRPSERYGEEPVAFVEKFRLRELLT